MRKLFGGFGLLLMAVTGSHLWSRVLPGSAVPDAVAKQLRGGLTTCGVIVAQCTVFDPACAMSNGFFKHKGIKSLAITANINPSVPYCSAGIGPNGPLGCAKSWNSKPCSE